MGASVGVEELLGLGLSPRTAYLYARTLARAGTVFAERGVDLLTCGASDVAAVTGLLPASHSSRSQLRASLMAAWDVLGRLDGPARAVRIPPKPRARSKALDELAARRLERAAWDRRGEDPGLAVLIGLYAALRRSEIARLRWDDLTVDATGRPEWLRVHGKGDLVADVPVHPVLADVLEERRRKLGWVFPGRDRTSPVRPETVWTWVRLVARDAGLNDVPTHVLRHTALTEANDRSGDLRAVQEIARHSRPETTAGYTRVRADRLRQVIAMVDYGRHAADRQEGVA